MQRWRHEDERVQDAALELNLRHLYVATWVLAALNLFHVVLFEVFLSSDTASQQTWVSGIVLAHMLMGGFVLLVNPLLRLCFLSAVKPKWASYLAETVVIVVFVWAIVVTVLDVQQGLGLHAYQNACAALAIAVLLRPWFAVVLFVGAAVLLGGCLSCIMDRGSLFSSHMVNAVTATSLALLVSILLWRRFVQTQLLQQELAQTNALLRKQQAELETLATTDGLTGLVNRRALMQRAEIEFRRVKRDAVPLSVLMLDIDHFKRVNDQWGHPAGDAVLCHVAQLMRQAVRETDVVARLGGEEFVLLLPGASQSVAHQLAEQLRLHIAASTLCWTGVSQALPPENTQPQSTPIKITISMGLVCLPFGREAGIDTLLNLADQALYRAKYLGRNRVEVALLV